MFNGGSSIILVGECEIPIIYISGIRVVNTHILVVKIHDQNWSNMINPHMFDLFFMVEKKPGRDSMRIFQPASKSHWRINLWIHLELFHWANPQSSPAKEWWLDMKAMKATKNGGFMGYTQQKEVVLMVLMVVFRVRPCQLSGLEDEFPWKMDDKTRIFRVQLLIYQRVTNKK